MLSIITGFFGWAWRSLTFRFRSEDGRAEIWAAECARVMLAGSALAAREGNPTLLTWAHLALHTLEARPNWSRLGPHRFSFGDQLVDFGGNLSIADVTHQVITTELSVMCAVYAPERRDALVETANHAIDGVFQGMDAAHHSGPFERR